MHIHLASPPFLQNIEFAQITSVKISEVSKIRHDWNVKDKNVKIDTYSKMSVNYAKQVKGVNNIKKIKTLKF